MKKLLLAALLSASALQVNAANILFDLIGTAGSGLLAGNEPQPLGSPSTASGGEIGAGLSYDDVANILTINVGWGSSQGFTDLSSLSTVAHIHGPTANNNGLGFTQTAGALFTLVRSSTAVTGGTFTTTSQALTEPQEADLLNGKWYINLHTANNGGGEIRGFLVAVPKPSTYALTGLGAAGLMFLRLRRKS